MSRLLAKVLVAVLAVALVVERLWSPALAQSGGDAAVSAARDDDDVNSIGMKLVRIPAGAFTMGSPAGEKGRRDDEMQHEVAISRDFDIGRFEVTRGQFRQFVEAAEYRTECERNGQGGYGAEPPDYKLSGRDPRYSWRFAGFEQTDDHPVINVSWNDAVAFCDWLSSRERRRYRLPTEAEWEYACRAGGAAAFPFGDDPEELRRYGNVVDADAKSVFPDRIAIRGSDGFIATAPVGAYRPNAWGLYDMHGNVWEWCADWFAAHSADAAHDPRGPSAEQPLGRVIKGGDWYHDWSFARPAQRFPMPPTVTRRHGGFRIVREAANEE
jgi:formylglycine-generating enzyme required for sulfatase activity